MDVLTKEQRHKNMSRIRNKDTKIEVKLRKELWRHGYRYRKNYDKLPGKPDIVIIKYRLVIFCDSEFFHGKNWEELKIRLEKSDNSKFWINKISNNIARDEMVNRELRYMGWNVIRFWGNDIKKSLESCVRAVDEIILKQKFETLC